MSSEFKISLVIPAYNEEQYIGKLLDSIVQNAPKAFHEVIVVDNASSDKTPEVARKYPFAKVVYEPAKGTQHAREKGYESSTGNLIAFADADSRIRAGWADQIQSKFSSHPELVFLSGPYTYYDMDAWRQFIAKIYWTFLVYPAFLFTKSISMGGNFVVRRETLEKMGGLDTSITFYGDDTDNARRAGTFGKVSFDLSFTMPSSARRLKTQGYVNTLFFYIINFFSGVFFHKVTTSEARDDIR